MISDRARFLSESISTLNDDVEDLAERYDNGNLSTADIEYVRKLILEIKGDAYVLKYQAEREDEESKHTRDTLKKLYGDLCLARRCKS